MGQLDNEVRDLRVLLTDKVEKRVALTVHQQVKTRIFDQGKDANDSNIGQYSLPYVKRRMKKGLGSSRKVVLEFTGQMRNDFLLVEDQGKIGSGFLNIRNADKSFWVEDTYNKEIFKLTRTEEDLVEKLFEAEVSRIVGA